MFVLCVTWLAAGFSMGEEKKKKAFKKKEAGVKMLTWLFSRPKRCLK